MSTTPPRRRPWRLSIAVYLGLGLGALTFAAVASVLAVTLWANVVNTGELLADKSRLLTGTLVRATRSYLDAIEAPTEVLAELIESGELDPDETGRLRAFSRTMLAAAPHIQALVYVDASGWLSANFRDGDGFGHDFQIWQGDPMVAEALADARQRRSSAAYWAAPVYIDEAGTNLNLRRPVVVDGQVRGMVVSTIRIAALSRFVAKLETEPGQVAFILYDRDKVLAHKALESDFPGLGDDRPLPLVTEVGDPVLFNIWREGWQERGIDIVQSRADGQVARADGRVARADGQVEGHFDDQLGPTYIYLYQELDHYADSAWLVGSYFAGPAIATQIRRLVKVAWVGVGGLVLAVASAFVFGRALRSPIQRLSAAATALRDLDLERVPKLPASRFHELHDASRAFNAMVLALRAFALYVPRALVVTLIRRGDVSDLPSESRDVTVLFTDIVGFTARTERMGAAATAAFLNDHFQLVTGCIEAEGGLVDKFIGDAVMALWNTAEAQDDHGLRAMRAAEAIARAIQEDNRRRDEPVRVRIGIHTGPVVVGNIGSATRMNYTVVGDAVNAAQRLEVMSKELMPDAEVAILLSAAAAASLPAEMPLRSFGLHRLRGLEAPTEVFGLALV